MSKKDKESKKSEEKAWFKKEGELAVDIYETEKSIVIQAPVAGVKKEDIEVITEKDTIVIKGHRECPKREDGEVKNFYTQECYFGDFRREVIMPEDFDPAQIEADINDSILTIEVPKIEKEKKRKIEL
ncbi:MAG: Hsp20/alpha crystallin family protein [Patescibacteria group bacterium]|jgi:HSP20 family protein|nr:Hsp20/alpha crystallin family protein [Patescibacteria group bacterium]